MANWQVALIREQGINFGVVIVQDHVIDNSNERDDLCRWWTNQLGYPIALMGAHRHRTYGRSDIVRWLSSIDPSRLPWRQINIAA